jgi:N-methylhydantoinase A
VPAGPVSVDRLLDDFVAEHVRTYGHGSRADAVELVSVRVLARVPSPSATTYDALQRIAALDRELGSREAYFGLVHGMVRTPVLSRAALIDGVMPGPFLVDEYDSTIVVPPGCSASLDRIGNVEVTIHA